jgi:nucleoside-diphosphate-sugar epimerase
MKKILILGHLGYIGPILINKLKPNYYICGVDTHWFRSKVNSKLSYNRYLPQKSIIEDIRKFSLSKLNFVPDAIIYLAAISNDPMGHEYKKITYEINTKYCLKIANEAKKMGVKKFIFASSCSIYGSAGKKKKKENHKLQPLTDYAKSKTQSEKQLKKISNKNFHIISLRFATAAGYSPKLRLDLVFNDFVANSIVNHEILILSNGKPWRPLIHVNDMARAVEWAIEYKSKINFFSINIGSDKWTFRIKDLAIKIAKILGNVKISLNKNSQPDKRSYRVDFSLFKLLAKNFQPKEKLDEAVKALAKNLKISKLNLNNFRNSKKFIRLKTLNYLQKNKYINKKLYWIK